LPRYGQLAFTADDRHRRNPHSYRCRLIQVNATSRRRSGLTVDQDGRFTLRRSSAVPMVAAAAHRTAQHESRSEQLITVPRCPKLSPTVLSSGSVSREAEPMVA
jgi:hypothetical protein